MSMFFFFFTLWPQQGDRIRLNNKTKKSNVIKRITKDVICNRVREENKIKKNKAIKEVMKDIRSLSMVKYINVM